MRRLFSRYSLYFFFFGISSFFLLMVQLPILLFACRRFLFAVLSPCLVLCTALFRYGAILAFCGMGLVGCDCLSSCGGGLRCWSQHSVRLATAFRWASCGSSLRSYATLSFYRSLPCFCFFSLVITTWFSSDTEFLALLAVGSLSRLPAFSLVVGSYLRLCLFFCCAFVGTAIVCNLLTSASLAPLRFFALVLRLFSCFWMVLWCGHTVPPFPSCDLDSVSIH